MAGDDHSRATAEDENAAALPPLRLGHSERHAPTFRPLDGQDELYDLAAWAFHYAQKLPLSLRAPFMAGLWRTWPRAKGRRSGVRGDDRGSGTRSKAQQAHAAVYVQNLSAEVTAESIGLSVERTMRLARSYVPEAEAERRHAAGKADHYGLPCVELAHPDRDAPEDVPDGAMLDAGWWGQMMLSDDPGRYRRRLHTMLDLYRQAYRRSTRASSEMSPPLSREQATKLWDRLDAEKQRKRDAAD